MPYLGNTPSTSFATVVKDSFSGDGSTVAFTLSKVATTNSVSVFVENVRQEPTTAYAVSGTTLTFTAAPVTSSGNNIYVLHMNPTTTTTHPAAQNLTAVNGTMTGTLGVTGASTLTGAVTANAGITMGGTTPTLTIGDAGAEDAKIVFDGNAQDYHMGLDDSADTLNIGKGSALGTTTHLSINENGFITKPETPMCSVTKNVNSQIQTISGSTNYTLSGMTSAYNNSHSVNNKSYWNTSNSRFEIPSGAPTAFYHCEFNVLLGIARPSSGVNWGFIGIRKDNSSGLSNNVSAQAYREATNGMGTSTYVYDMLSCACVYSLAAGDYVEPIFSGSDGVAIVIHSGNYTNFTVIQIG